MSCAALVTVLKNGKDVPAYFRIQHTDVDADFSTFQQRVISPSLGRCQKDFLPKKRPQPPGNLFQQIPKSGSETAERRRDLEGPFLSTNMDSGCVRRLLLADLYQAALEKRDFVLYVRKGSKYCGDLERIVTINKLSHCYKYMQTPSPTPVLYICVDAAFVSGPSTVTLENLVKDDQIASNVLGRATHDTFTIKIPRTPNEFSIDLIDFIKDHVVMCFAPLPDRWNRIANYLQDVPRGQVRNVATQGLLHEANGDASQSYEITTAWSALEAAAFRRKGTYQNERVKHLKTEVKKTAKQAEKLQKKAVKLAERAKRKPAKKAPPKAKPKAPLKATLPPKQDSQVAEKAD